jgi:steroid delta-isomerase-like uncharacterized protein
MSEANKAVLRRWVDDGLNQGNLDFLDELFAGDFVYHGPGGMTMHGTQEPKDFVAGYLRAFPDLHTTIEDQIAEGDRVVTRVTYQGTHTGPLGEIAPTGKRVRITAVWIDRFAHGKVVEEWDSFDELWLMRQIGALPAAAAV